MQRAGDVERRLSRSVHGTDALEKDIGGGEEREPGVGAGALQRSSIRERFATAEPNE